MRKTLEEYLVGIPNQDMVSRWLLTAQYYIENGDEDLGAEYLIKLCTETVDNYEEAIGFRELTPVWEQYKHLAAGIWSGCSACGKLGAVHSYSIRTKVKKAIGILEIYTGSVVWYTEVKGE